MAKPFDELRERLLRAGAAPRHVRRYLSEVADHLADLRAEEERAGRSPADAESAALIRLGGMDDLAKSMIEQRQFRAWSARAPWAIFGLAPLFLLAGVWFVSLLILWFGWQVFLPGADTPFGHRPGTHRIFELANIYFQLDRLLYFAAPVLVGWGIGLLAARQRLKAVWPSVGFFLIALIGGLAQVQASRTAVPHGLGHISMSFAFAPTIHGGPFGLLQMLLLPMIALPYLVWRFRKAHSLSA
ncbi:MAG TPA: permease prefix domain 1-containing protein [Edaphobacter sp.]|nr:permease prefix domain 1-containing protein [Edaphobacter sp.]